MITAWPIARQVVGRRPRLHVFVVLYMNCEVGVSFHVFCCVMVPLSHHVSESPRHVLALGSVCLLKPQLGEDAHQHHDGHHPADDVHDQVGLVPGGVVQGVVDAWRGLGGVQPDGPVVVGASGLVQAGLLELAAEAEATGPATERELPRAAVERGVPLPHDVEVTPTGVRGLGVFRRSGVPGTAVVASRDYHDASKMLPGFTLRPAERAQKVHQKVAEDGPARLHGPCAGRCGCPAVAGSGG